MKTSETLTKLAPALVLVHKALKTVVKDSTNPHFKNKYASLEAINDAVRPILASHGFAAVQGVTYPTTNSDGQLTCANITTRLQHESGEWIETDVVMPLDKATAQGAGSAITYGRRYGLSAALALSTDEDDDGHAASQRPASSAKPQSNGKPATNNAPRSSGGDSGSFVMPFGKSKGLTLNELDGKDLRGAYDWAREKDKFVEFQAAALAELEKREFAPVGAPDDDPPDDLPF